MRNPFPKIGKVMKYDFMHSSRRLLPMYAALLIAGLVIGIFINPIGMLIGLESEESTYMFSNGFTQFMTILMFIIFYSLEFLCFVLTIVEIGRRYKSSMIGEEAYMNLSLPVTMAEHLWGKMFSSIVWMICCFIVCTLAGVFCLIRADVVEGIKLLIQGLPEINTELANQGLSIGGIIATLTVFFFCGSLWIITFIYIVPAISILFRNKRGIIKILTIAVIFTFQGFVQKIVPFIDSDLVNIPAGKIFYTDMLLLSGLLVIYSAIYFTITHVIFYKRLNLD